MFSGENQPKKPQDLGTCPFSRSYAFDFARGGHYEERQCTGVKCHIWCEVCKCCSLKHKHKK